MILTSQKDAVVQAVKNQLGGRYDASKDCSLVLTQVDRQSVVLKIVEGISGGTIVYSKDAANRQEIQKYASGLVSNHLRKAKELNGGVGYSINTSTKKAPVNKDARLFALNKLLSVLTPGTKDYEDTVTMINTLQ